MFAIKPEQAIWSIDMNRPDYDVLLGGMLHGVYFFALSKVPRWFLLGGLPLIYISPEILDQMQEQTRSFLAKNVSMINADGKIYLSPYQLKRFEIGEVNPLE